MDCVYLENLVDYNNEIITEGRTSAHLRALKLNFGEEVMLTDGKGNTVIAVLESIIKNSFKFSIKEKFSRLNELPFKLGLAFGILSDRNRFEFALEKSVEFGITHFYPLQTKHSQKKSIASERLLAKSIAAIIQSKRSVLPIISPVIQVNSIPEISKKYDVTVLCDVEGEKPEFNIKKIKILLMVGPEGGFSEDEIEFFENIRNLRKVKLSNNRLRAETASVLATGIYSIF